MHVLIAFNEPVLPATHFEVDSEREILDVVASIAERLDLLGVDFKQFGVGRDLTLFSDVLHELQPDLVLNLFEGFADAPDSECQFVHLMEDEGVDFTGASSHVLWRTGRKGIAKQILANAGLLTPAWFTVEELSLSGSPIGWPLIVKPAYRDASIGIHQTSVVTHLAQLRKAIRRTAAQYGLPVLIEGREISAAVFDWPVLTVLPLVEMKFSSSNGGWPIDSYDAKWRPDSRDYKASTLCYPAELPAELEQRVIAAAKAAYQAIGCRGFVTIDFRTRDETPYILEVNSNPDLKPSTYFTGLLQMSGIDYNSFLWQMIQDAAAKNVAVGQL